MPPETAARRRVPDRGMQVLELKLSILAQGPSRTQRNPALDILTGRVPDDRLLSLSASLSATRSAPEPGSLSTGVTPARVGLEAGSLSTGLTPARDRPVAASGPASMVLPIAAIRMAAVARSPRRAPSPWLQSTAETPVRLKLVSPPPSRWSRVPWLGAVLAWLRVEYRPYRWTVRSPRAHPAS